MHQYNKLYGVQLENAIEIVNFHFTFYQKSKKPEIGINLYKKEKKIDPIRFRTISFFGKKNVKSGVFKREDLKPGHFLFGPAAIEELGSVSLIGPHYTAKVDHFHNLLVSAEN